MSVIRQIKINYDLDRLKKVCQELGLYIKDDATTREILGDVLPEVEPLNFAVAKTSGQTKFNLGFKQKEDSTYIYVDKYYKENDLLMQEIITKYVIDSLYPYYSVAEIKAKSNKEVVLVFTK